MANLSKKFSIFKALKCKRCDLHKNRTNVVYGSGNSSPKLMFVGEAPGYWENKKGLPFVGKAGKLLDDLLEGIGLKRKEVYITNAVKCQPPNNRNPNEGEIGRCKGYLLQQIREVDPQVICTLGKIATKTLLRTDREMKDLHGQVFDNGKRKLFVSYHPAYGVYNRSNIKILEEDFFKLKQFSRTLKMRKRRKQ